MITTIGIDPGVTGAIAIFQNHDLVRLEDMPVMYGRIDVELVRNILAYERPDHIAIEEVSIRGNQGNAKTILANWGRLEYATELWPVTILRPQDWSRTVGRPTGLSKPERKQWSLERVRFLFPDMADGLARKKDNGRAEAALIAMAYLIKTRKAAA